jgi:protocadherin delta 1
MLVPLLLSLLLLPVTMSELLYTILEELDIGSPVGDLVSDAQLSNRHPPEVVRSLRFTFLTPPAIPLVVDETSGKIITSGRIDRETVCRTVTADVDLPCRVRLDVAVHPVQYFQMIKIVIEIRDINDNSPEFVPSAIVREIAESSPAGTGFVIPTARDADTDRYGVSRYLITGGQDSGLFDLNISRKLDGSTEVRC